LNTVRFAVRDGLLALSDSKPRFDMGARLGV